MSKKWNVYIPDFLPPTKPQRELLDTVADLSFGLAHDQEDLIRRIKESDAVLITSTTKMTREVIMAGSHLKVISKYGVGLENIDLVAATEAGIPVTHVPGVNSQATAELAIALMLAGIRHIQDARRQMETGGWRNATLIGPEIRGTIIGLIGYGNIAQRVAHMLIGFDLKELLIFSQTKQHMPRPFETARFVTLNELLKESDIISIHKTLTPHSKGMIGHREFQMMKKSSFLVNTSRGDLVQEEALIEALEKKQIAGAALDVFHTEPLPVSSPLMGFPQVVVTPHIGGSTFNARRHVVIAAMNVVRALRDQPFDPTCLANPDVLRRTQ